MSGEPEMNQQRRNQGPLLRFTKMHGLGNDFMVVDAISQPFRLRPEMIRELADRNFVSVLNNFWLWRPRGCPMWVSVIGYSMPMALGFSRVGMAPGALPSLSAISG